jgi:hypothetical protein
MISQMPFELQGHRGARGHAPENTLPGFELALGMGVQTLEGDPPRPASQPRRRSRARPEVGFGARRSDFFNAL